MNIIRTAIHYAGAFLAGVARFFVNQWNQYTAIGQFLFVLALGAIVNDAAISYRYGESTSTLHATGFAVVALAFCILPDVAVTEWRKGKRAAATFLGAACLFVLFPVAFQSHIGYGGSVRLGDMQQTLFKNTSVEDARTDVAEKRTTLALLRGQLASVQERIKEADARNSGWVVSVDPTAMQASLDALDVKIASEKKGGRGGRGAGCGAVCEALTVERGQLAARIDLAKQENDLTGQVRNLEAQIETKNAEIAAMGYRSSTVVNQNDILAKLWNLVAIGFGHEIDAEDAIKPVGWQQQVVNVISAGTASLAFMLCGPLLWMGAGFNRIAGAVGGPVGGGHGAVTTETASAHSQPATEYKSATVTPLRPAAPAATLAGLEAVHDRRARINERLLQMRQSRVDGALLAA